MPKSTQDQLLIAEFIKEIDETAEQFRELLQNLHNIEEHKLDFVELKTKLTILFEDFKDLSSMVKAESEEQNSLLTRLTVLEQSVNELKKYIGEDAAADTIIITKIALIEEKVTATGKKLSESTLDEMDKYWEESKKDF